MNKDVEKHIKEGHLWCKLPERARMACGNSEEEYNRAFIEYAIKNQVRFRGSNVPQVFKNEKTYYERLLQYSKNHLMLYPYHLQERMIGLRQTAFAYYISMMEDTMRDEKSYDALPNFTAADCLRLLGIGRNQYIELMNNSRSSKKFTFRRKPQFREYLPKTPIPVNIEPWWTVHVGFITVDDIKLCGTKMKTCIDNLIDNGPTMACLIEREMLDKLYMKGLVFLDVPVHDNTVVAVPPLEGFVMNRVLGDYFETLLYKIFVSIDEKTSLAELSKVLDIDLDLVKNAVSVFCRLGFARLKENFDVNSEPKAHSSWKQQNKSRNASSSSGSLLQYGPSLLDLDFSDDAEGFSVLNSHFEDIGGGQDHDDLTLGGSRDDSGRLTGDDTSSIASHTSGTSLPQSCNSGKRIAFLFDSSLTAFLMMGNLSPGLKNHAVTLFEVGKLTDEGVGNFITELHKVRSVEHDEGEARRYFDHAVNLRMTVEFLRHNKYLTSIFCNEESENEAEIRGIGLDLIRCESLSGLDRKTATRLINKNYHVVVAMAPLNDDIVTNLKLADVENHSDTNSDDSSVGAYWFGPPSAIVNSIWFKLYIYHTTGYGPPTLLLSRGQKLCHLPSEFEDYEDLLITSVGHEPCVIPTSNALLMLCEALTHSPVLVQGYGLKGYKTEKAYLTFPFKVSNDDDLPDQSVLDYIEDVDDTSDLESGSKTRPNLNKDIVETLKSSLDLGSSCGYATFLRYTPYKKNKDASGPPCDGGVKWQLLNVSFGIPLFDKVLNHEVCARFISHKLCDVQNASQLLKSNTLLSDKVQKFVTEVQNTSPQFGGSQMDENVPFPEQSLFFAQDKLSLWEGL